MNTFEIKPEHLKLLQHAYVGWDDCEFGAPEIDCKRPYGNSGVIQDILEILGVKTLREGVYEFAFGGRTWLLKGEDEYNIEFVGAEDEVLRDTLVQLHKETAIALQICLVVQKFEAGIYEKFEPYNDRAWRKVA